MPEVICSIYNDGELSQNKKMIYKILNPVILPVLLANLCAADIFSLRTSGGGNKLPQDPQNEFCCVLCRAFLINLSQDFLENNRLFFFEKDMTVLAKKYVKRKYISTRNGTRIRLIFEPIHFSARESILFFLIRGISRIIEHFQNGPTYSREEFKIHLEEEHGLFGNRWGGNDFNFVALDDLDFDEINMERFEEMAQNVKYDKSYDLIHSFYRKKVIREAFLSSFNLQKMRTEQDSLGFLLYCSLNTAKNTFFKTLYQSTHEEIFLHYLIFETAKQLKFPFLTVS